MQQATAKDRYVRQVSEYREDSSYEAVESFACFVDIATSTLASSDRMVVTFLVHGVLIQRKCGPIIFLKDYNAHVYGTPITKSLTGIKFYRIFLLKFHILVIRYIVNSKTWKNFWNYLRKEFLCSCSCRLKCVALACRIPAT